MDFRCRLHPPASHLPSHLRLHLTPHPTHLRLCPLIESPAKLDHCQCRLDTLTLAPYRPPLLLRVQCDYPIRQGRQPEPDHWRLEIPAQQKLSHPYRLHLLSSPFRHCLPCLSRQSSEAIQITRLWRSLFNRTTTVPAITRRKPSKSAIHGSGSNSDMLSVGKPSSWNTRRLHPQLPGVDRYTFGRERSQLVPSFSIIDLQCHTWT